MKKTLLARQKFHQKSYSVKTRASNNWILTSMGTYEGPYPCLECTKGMQQEQFRRSDRSSAPSSSFLDGSASYAWSYRWSNLPIVQRQWIQRKQCGRYIPKSSCLGRSTKKSSSKIKERWINRKRIWHICEVEVLVATYFFFCESCQMDLPIPDRTSQSNRW